MSDDIRVILIKICDRLHNMRTLESQPANKQYKIAGETYIFTLPSRQPLGLNKIKTELERPQLPKHDHPQEYANIEHKLARYRIAARCPLRVLLHPIREELDKMGVEYKIKAREEPLFYLEQDAEQSTLPSMRFTTFLLAHHLYAKGKSKRR